MPNTPGIDRARRRAGRAGAMVGIIFVAAITLIVAIVVLWNR